MLYKVPPAAVGVAFVFFFIRTVLFARNATAIGRIDSKITLHYEIGVVRRNHYARR